MIKSSSSEEDVFSKVLDVAPEKCDTLRVIDGGKLGGTSGPGKGMMAGS